MVKEYIHFHTEVNKEVNGLDIQITPVILSRDRTFVEYKKGKFQRFYRAINISSLKITKFRFTRSLDYLCLQCPKYRRHCISKTFLTLPCRRVIRQVCMNLIFHAYIKIRSCLLNTSTGDILLSSLSHMLFIPFQAYVIHSATLLNDVMTAQS